MAIAADTSIALNVGKSQFLADAHVVIERVSVFLGVLVLVVVGLIISGRVADGGFARS